MNELNPISRTLLAVLDNQVARTDRALEGLQSDVFDASPGGDCNSIRSIGEHLLQLRKFQLKLLESPLADKVADPGCVQSPDTLSAKLAEAVDLLRQAIASHDPDDWFRKPDSPRKGPWGDEPTIERFVKPLNDFTSHLGGIRTIRRMSNNPAEGTQ